MGSPWQVGDVVATESAWLVKKVYLIPDGRPTGRGQTSGF